MQFSGQFITGIGSWDSGFCNLLWKRCSNNGHRLWASGEHIMLSSKLHLQSGLIWYVAVKKWTGYQTSGHCIWASGEHTTPRYSTAYAVWFHFDMAMLWKKLIGSWDFGIVPLGIQGANKAWLFLLHMQFHSFDRAMFG